MEKDYFLVYNIINLCLLLHVSAFVWQQDDLGDLLSTLNDTDAWILCETKFPAYKKILNESILSSDKCRVNCKFSDGKTNPVFANQIDGKSCPSGTSNQGICSKGYCLDRNDPFSACNAHDDIKGNVQKTGSKFADTDHCTADCALQGWSQTRNVNDGQPCASKNDSNHFCSAGHCIVQTQDDLEATKLCDSLPEIKGNVDKLGNSFVDADKCVATCSVYGFKQDKNVNDDQPCASHNDTTHFCKNGKCIMVSQDDTDATKACNQIPEIKGNVDKIGSKFADPDKCTAQCSVNGFDQNKNVNEGKQCATKNDEKHVCHSGLCTTTW